MKETTDTRYGMERMRLRGSYGDITLPMRISEMLHWRAYDHGCLSSIQ